MYLFGFISNRLLKTSEEFKKLKKSEEFKKLIKTLLCVGIVHRMSKKDMNRLAHAINGNTKWCVECTLKRRSDGNLQAECRHHRHPTRMTENDGKKKDEVKGANKRILEKYTTSCKNGVECKKAGHHHEDPDDNDDEDKPKRISNGNHKSLSLVPRELKLSANGLIDWNCLLEMEHYHIKDGVFDLRHNALPTGEHHHRCTRCLRYVVRLSGAHKTPRSERPCYACLELDVPRWYVLKDRRSVIDVEPHDSDDDDEETVSPPPVPNVPAGPGAVVREIIPQTVVVQEPVIVTGPMLLGLRQADEPIVVPTVPVVDEVAASAPATCVPPAVAVPAVSIPPNVEADEREPEAAVIATPDETRTEIEVIPVVPEVAVAVASKKDVPMEVRSVDKNTWKGLAYILTALMFINPTNWSVLSCLFAFVNSGMFFVYGLIGYMFLIPYSIFRFFFHDKPYVVDKKRVIRCPTVPVTPSFYLAYFVAIQLILPIGLVWFSFDLFLWPGLCIALADALSEGYGNIIGYSLGMGLFQAENVVTLLYGLMMAWIYKSIMRGFTVTRMYVIVDCDEQPEATYRPKKQSFAKVEHVMDIKDVEVYETYTYGIATLALSFDFYVVKLKTGKMCGTLFFDETAPSGGKRKGRELESYLQGQFEKAGYIDWNREYMSDNRIIQTTIEVIMAWEMEGQREEVENPLSRYNLVLFGPSTHRPWWTVGHIHKFISVIALAALIFGFVYMAYQFIKFLFAIWVFIQATATFGGSCLGALHNATKFPGAEGSEIVEHPKGVFGFRVYDNIAGRYDQDTGDWVPMKTNLVGANKDLEIRLDSKNVDPRSIPRVMMGAFSPFFSPGFAMPKGDLKCWLTFWCGLIHRGAGKTPTPNQNVLDSKGAYADEILRALITPACEADIMDTEEALNQTSYTEKRKDQIREWESAAQEFDDSEGKCTAPFGKDEPKVSTGKHDRTIQGGHETLWAGGIFGSLGRFVKTMEHAIYPMIPCNIKQMKPVDQVRKILGLGPGTKTVNDFSSYEASFSREVQESAQFRAYDHYFQNTSYAEVVPKHARTMLGSRNTMKSKYGTAKISNLKCSGDFDTSFSNWFDNVVTLCHIFWVKFEVHWTDAMNWILCEGDDNITDDQGFELTNEDFAPYGLTAKVETGLDLVEAGFCQRFINHTGNLLGDPIRYFGKCQYIPIQYANAKMSKKLGMVKAKAMSTLAFTPDCPVISEHAWRVLELTQGIYVSHKMLAKAKKYNVEILSLTNFRKPVILEADRLAMSEVFGFTLEQQRIVTESLAKWNGGPFQLPVDWFPDNWVEFYDEYSTVEKESTLLGWGNDSFFDYFTGRLGEVTK